MSELEMPTVEGAARAIAQGEASARELTAVCLAAIDRLDPPLHAFVHLGTLAGVPFGVKDLENCAGMPTTRGSRWVVDRPAVTDDDIHVGLLCAAGGIPVGKTATPEFGAFADTASPAPGVTRNPWDPTRTPGVSSGGSSAAVSAGMVPFCTASDPRHAPVAGASPV